MFWLKTSLEVKFKPFAYRQFVTDNFCRLLKNFLSFGNARRGSSVGRRSLPHVHHEASVGRRSLPHMHHEASVGRRSFPHVHHEASVGRRSLPMGWSGGLSRASQPGNGLVTRPQYGFVACQWAGHEASVWLRSLPMGWS